jgi:hypothetical protein
MTNQAKRDLRTLLVLIGFAGSYILNWVSAGMSFELYISLFILSFALTLWGCYLWVDLKNRKKVFMLWGLLTPIGLLGISLLKDKSHDDDIEDTPEDLVQPTE